MVLVDHIMVYTMIKSTFTLLYNTMSYLFCTTIHQIIVSHKIVLYVNHLHFVQSGGWICAVRVKTGLCALCSRDLNEWQVASVLSIPVVLLSPAQLCEHHIGLMFTLGKRDLVWDNSHSKQWFNHRFAMFLYTTITLHNFALYSRMILYEMMFHTIVWMSG